MRGTIVFAVGLGLLGAGAPSSSAEGGEPAPPPRLAVVVLPGSAGSSEDRSAIEGALVSQALLHSGLGSAWRLIAYPSSNPMRNEAEVLQEVRKKVEEGKQAYRYLKLPDAKAAFLRSLMLLKSNPPAKCDRKLLAEMYLYSARAALDSGDEKGAGVLLAQIPRFDPSAGPDPAVMPPNLVATYDVALEDWRSKPRGKVIVEVGPGQGALFSDCDPKPAGMVELSGPAGSVFWLAAQVEGGAFRGSFTFPEGSPRQLLVWSGQPGDMARIADQLGKTSKAPIAVEALPPAGRPELDSFAGAVGAQILLLGDVRPAAEGKVVRLALYVPGRGVQGKPVDIPLGPDRVLDPDVLAGSFDGLTKTARSPSILMALSSQQKDAKTVPVKTAEFRHEDKERGATPWFKTWWFWSATGAVVVGGVLTAVLIGSSGSGSSPSGNVVVRISPP